MMQRGVVVGRTVDHGVEVVVVAPLPVVPGLGIVEAARPRVSDGLPKVRSVRHLHSDSEE